MSTPLRVLILEDRPADAELMVQELGRSGFDPSWHRVETEAEYLAHLDAGPEVILADYGLPQFDASRALALLQARGLDIPFLVVSGSISEEVAVDCMKQGAADYLLKDRLGRLGPAVAQALEAKRLRDEKREAEQALRESEAYHRLVMDTVRDAIFLTDLDGRLILSNRRGPELTGYEAHELVGRWLIDILTPEGAARAQTRLASVRAGQEVPSVLETEVVRKDGRRVPVEVLFSNLVEGGRTVARLGVARDVTERKRTEEELARQRDTLYRTEKLAAMGELLAGVAHELNNPLTAILGQAALLQQGAGSGPLAARAEGITQAALRCARIVKNFLALARQEPPQRDRVRLNQVVEGALELLAYPLRVDGVEVELDLAGDLPVLWADPQQLHQVVVNLLTNAHQAMRAGRPPRRLTLTTGTDPSAARVWLEVADTGPGIPAGLQARIFEPFFTTKPVGQGTGLGLSLCRGIVESHGGGIDLEGRPGHGAVFRVELPAVAPPLASPAAAAGGSPDPIRPATILVVDDEPEVAEVLAGLLRVDGHQVDTAANGLAALERLMERTYDLVLSDMKMPELDGPGLHRALEERDPGLARRVVFMTGDGLSPATRQFLEARAGVPSLGKPFSLEEVRRVVRHVLRDGRDEA